MKGFAAIVILLFVNGTLAISSNGKEKDNRPFEEDSIVFGESPYVLHKSAFNDDSAVEREVEVVDDSRILSSHERPSSNPDLSSCGAPSDASTNKAIGGLLAPEGKYPWVAALIYYDHQNRSRLTCSGVLISKNLVLTTAECIRRQTGIPDEIRIGTTRLDRRKNGGQAVNTFAAFVYKNFDLQDLKGNIAVVLLEDNVEINEFVQPVCLADFDDSQILRKGMTGQALETAAWNFTEGLGGKLLTFKSDITDLSKCVYSNRKKLTSSDICVYSARREGRVCDTDIGAPLMAELNGKVYVVGLLSHASPCNATQGTAAVYTRIFSYASWIKTKIAEIENLD